MSKKTDLDKSLDETLDSMLKEESAQTEAVKSLIRVKEKVLGELGTDIELKTDLTEKDICLHTSVDMLSFILDMKKGDFAKNAIIGHLTNLKERKLLSKDRKSRSEIVEVAKTPDMKMFSDMPMQQSPIKRFFMGRRNQQY